MEKKLKPDYKKSFYTLDTKDGIPCVTVCIIYDKQTHTAARGLAILSREDVYNEQERFWVAERNAIRAMKGKSVDAIKDPRAIAQLIRCLCPFTVRGEKFAKLSFWERRYMFGKKWREILLLSKDSIQIVSAANRDPWTIGNLKIRPRLFVKKETSFQDVPSTMPDLAFNIQKE